MFISSMFSVSTKPFVCSSPAIVALNRTMLPESSVLPLANVFYVDRGIVFCLKPAIAAVNRNILS